MTTIDLQIKDDAVAGALARVAAALTDLSPLMEEIGATLADQTDERFRTGTAPDGTLWAPRSPVTMANYARRGDKPGPRPLIGASRRLSTTIHYQAGADSVEIGSAAVQAAVMQFGAAKSAFGPRTPWGDIPARPFIGLSEANRSDILGTIDEWLTRAMQG